MVTNNDNTRLAFMMNLKPGMVAEYEKRHDELWPEMYSALKKSGYSNYTLFRSGQTVFGYAECTPDVETTTTRMANNPITTLWNESFKDIIESIGPSGNYAIGLEEIWHIN